jgi:ribonucleotide reductase alpha subunit
MLVASAVDAMLKLKGYADGTLNARIDKASAEHVITADMAQWAHKLRLDANDQRHVDEGASLPTAADAQRSVEFATALGHFMFVLPARIQKGLEAASGPSR